MEIILSVLVSSGVLAAVAKWATSHIEKSLKASREHDKAVQDGLRAMLCDRMQQLARMCIHDDYASVKDRETFEAMYKSYKALGGNGIVDGIRAELFELPFVRPE